MLIKLSNKRPS